MLRILHVLNGMVIATGIFLCFRGFGHGLGDLYYLFILVPCILVHVIWTFKVRKEKHPVEILVPLCIFFITTLMFLLQAAIWRGPESR
jgi:hypothetical protein